MGVTRLLLLGLFYTIQTQRCQTLWTRVYMLLQCGIIMSGMESWKKNLCFQKKKIRSFLTKKNMQYVLLLPFERKMLKINNVHKSADVQKSLKDYSTFTNWTLMQSSKIFFFSERPFSCSWLGSGKRFALCQFVRTGKAFPDPNHEQGKGCLPEKYNLTIPN